jgi:hypothetical protein
MGRRIDCAKPRPPLPRFVVDPADPDEQRWACLWRSWPATQQWLVHDFLLDLEDWFTRHPQPTRSQVLRFIRRWAHARDWDVLADYFDALDQKHEP